MPKKEKKSKEQLEAERLAREEEERKQRELEEKLAEEARIRAEEAAKKLQEEQIAYRREELGRLKGEVESHVKRIQVYKSRLDKASEKENHELEWSKYLECATTPDSSSLKELNTFLALAESDDSVAADSPEALTKEIAYYLKIIDKIEGEISYAQCNKDSTSYKLYNIVLNKFIENIQTIIDRSTAKILNDSIKKSNNSENKEQKKDTNKGELLLTSYQDKNFRMGFWINREPRMKKKLIDLKDAGTTVDITKQVGSQYCCMRTMVLPLPRVVPRGLSDLLPGGYGLDEDFTTVSKADSKNNENINTSNAIPDGASSRRNSLIASKNDPFSVAEEKNEYKKNEITNEINEEEKVSQSDTLVLGPIFTLDLVSLPKPPNVVKGWIMKTASRLNDDVEHITYPLGCDENAPLSSLAAAIPLRPTFEIPSNIILPADTENLRVGWWDKFNGRWDEDFVTDVEYKYEVDEDANPDAGVKIVRFNTIKVGHFAILFPRIQDYLYTSWSLSPMFNLISKTHPLPSSVNSVIPEVHLTINTTRFEVVIAVVGSTEQSKKPKCLLKAPALAEISHLLNIPFEPAELLHRLSRCGLHLLPANKDTDALSRSSHNNQTWRVKTAEVEDYVYEEMAAFCTSFDFHSSSWNSKIGSNKTVLQMRETSNFTGFNEDTLDYNLVLMELDVVSLSATNAPLEGSLGNHGVKVTILELEEGQGKADEKGFDMTPKEGTSSHISLHQVTSEGDWCTPAAIARTDNINVQFQNCVKQLLQLTRVASFAK